MGCCSRFEHVEYPNGVDLYNLCVLYLVETTLCDKVFKLF